MISVFGKLWRNKRGNTLAIAAACLPLFMGAAGLATDTIQWTLWKRQLQRAADSAAIAGVYDREAANGATTTTDAAVSRDIDLNLHTFYSLQTSRPNCTGGRCTIAYPASTAFLRNQVSVTISIQQPLAFSSLFMNSAPVIQATSTAASVPAGGDACVQALEPTAVTGITITGNAGINMPDCIMYSNSPSANSASAGGSSSVIAEAVAAVGGIQQSNNWQVQAYRPYSPSLPDPFAAVNPPTTFPGGSCPSQTVNSNQTATLNPGCYSGLNLKGNVTLNPGTYVIDGGSLSFGAQAVVNCTGCTFVLTNRNTSPTATIGNLDMNGGAQVNISAPTDGAYRGIAFYQDRRAANCSNCNKINGNSSSVVTGAIYFPSQELQYLGTGNTTATCTMIVARRVTFTGNSSTANRFRRLSDCAAAGLPSGGAIRMVRLVG